MAIVNEFHSRLQGIEKALCSLMYESEIHVYKVGKGSYEERLEAIKNALLKSPCIITDRTSHTLDRIRVLESALINTNIDMGKQSQKMKEILEVLNSFVDQHEQDVSDLKCEVTDLKNNIEVREKRLRDLLDDKAKEITEEIETRFTRSTLSSGVYGRTADDCVSAKKLTREERDAVGESETFWKEDILERLDESRRSHGWVGPGSVRYSENFDGRIAIKIITSTEDNVLIAVERQEHKDVNVTWTYRVSENDDRWVDFVSEGSNRMAFSIFAGKSLIDVKSWFEEVTQRNLLRCEFAKQDESSSLWVPDIPPLKIEFQASHPIYGPVRMAERFTDSQKDAYALFAKQVKNFVLYGDQPNDGLDEFQQKLHRLRPSGTHRTPPSIFALGLSKSPVVSEFATKDLAVQFKIRIDDADDLPVKVLVSPYDSRWIDFVTRLNEKWVGYSIYVGEPMASVEPMVLGDLDDGKITGCRLYPVQSPVNGEWTYTCTGFDDDWVYGVITTPNYCATADQINVREPRQTINSRYIYLWLDMSHFGYGRNIELPQDVYTDGYTLTQGGAADKWLLKLRRKVGHDNKEQET